jgi:molecular chaperone DnaK
VDIVVYQGERPMARDNKLLGHFRLDGIKPARRGQPRIEVTFDIDVNGIVKVTAKDLDTQKEQHITITNSSGLSKEEIDRMVKDAEEHKEADEKRKKNVELKNRAEQYINEIEYSLEEGGDKVDANQKEASEKLVTELKEAIEKEDYETLEKRLSELEQMAQMMQNMQQGQAEGETSATETPKDDDIIDADFTDKKD